MGNGSDRVASVHPVVRGGTPGVIIHNPEFARWAASEKGDDAVIEGAKALAMTALDLMAEPELLKSARSDFEATVEFSKSALARSREPVGHAHATGCGCA